jgi:hypothetical protein
VHRRVALVIRRVDVRAQLSTKPRSARGRTSATRERWPLPGEVCHSSGGTFEGVLPARS